MNWKPFRSFWDWLTSLWRGGDSTHTPNPKPSTPASPSPPPAPIPSCELIPVKLAHGPEVPYAFPKVGDDAGEIGGVRFRCFEIVQDGACLREVMRANAIAVRGGKSVAHDFVNSAGQVMAWQYWTLGTSDISAKSVENPVHTPNDTRVWYRCYEGA